MALTPDSLHRSEDPGTLWFGSARMALLDVEAGFWTLRRSLTALAGRRLTSVVLQRAGANSGASFARSLTAGIAPEQAREAVRDCVSAIQAAGLGEFTVESLTWPLGRAVVRGRFTFESWMFIRHGGSLDGPVCAYSAGVLAGMMNTLGWNEAPRSAQALGGIFRFPDGRNMPDFHVVLFDYHGIPVYVRLDLGCETEELARFMGPKGYMDTGEFYIRHQFQPGIDLAPSYYSSSFPQKMREEYVADWHAKHDPPLGKEPMYPTNVYAGHDWDDVKPHLWNFFQAVKSRKPVREDAVFGNHAAIACHMANESYFRKKPVYWDEASKSIHT